MIGVMGFSDEQIRSILELNVNDLKELGIEKLGHRKIILQHINKLKN